MVDALKRAHRMLRPGGSLVELHPSSATPPVEVNGVVVGRVDTRGAPERHAAAGRALAAAVAEGLFVVTSTASFDFFTYGDSIEELRGYVQENWRDARIAARVVKRARGVLASKAGSRPRVRERVEASRLFRA
jgi:hypothetical protein